MSTQIVGRDEYGRQLDPAYTSSLSYEKGSMTRVFRFWLETLEQPHTLSGSKAQSQFYQHFYAKGYAPQPVSITGRVRDQAMKDDLAQYVRDHQVLMVSSRGSNNPASNASDFQLPLMTLRVPSEGLVFTGWIERFEGGAKRFDVAPQFSFAFNVIDDRHSTNDSIVPSHALRAVFTGAFLSGPVQQTPTTNVSPETQNSASAVQQESRAAVIKSQIEPGAN